MMPSPGLRIRTRMASCRNKCNRYSRNLDGSEVGPERSAATRGSVLLFGQQFQSLLFLDDHPLACADAKHIGHVAVGREIPQAPVDQTLRKVNRQRHPPL